MKFISTVQQIATVWSLITDQPEITTHPISTVIIEGGDLLLTCNATGNPAPLISWNKYEFLINASGDPRISFTEQNTKLRIKNVSRVDDGQYRCVASNSLGNGTSSAAILDVQSKNAMTSLPHVSSMWKYISEHCSKH